MTRNLDEVINAVKAKPDTKFYRWNSVTKKWEFLLKGKYSSGWTDSVDLRKMDEEDGRVILAEVGKIIVPFEESKHEETK